MALTAQAGLGSVTAKDRAPGGSGVPELTLDQVLGSPVPELKPGERLFRSRRAGLGIVLRSTLTQVVGGVTVPGTWQNIKFEPKGDPGMPFGELRTEDPDVIARIEGHRYYRDGTVVDAVEAHKGLKKAERAAILARADADPEFEQELLKHLRKKGGPTGFGELLEPGGDKKQKTA